MANTAAYAGLQWGELTVLTTGQVDAPARVITVDRKVIEVAGHLYLEPPKNRKQRRTFYPRTTPAGYLPADGSLLRVVRQRLRLSRGRGARRSLDRCLSCVSDSRSCPAAGCASEHVS